MNTNSRLIIFLLSLVTLGCALFAYREHSRQITSQNTADSLSKELAALRLRLKQMEKGPIPLQDPLSLGPVPASTLTVKPSAISSRQMPDIRNDMGFGGGGFGNLMNNPEIQKLMSIQQRAALDTRYAGLFHQLNLNPVDLDKFKSLLVEKQTAAMDAMTAARQQGLSGPENRDALKQVIANAQTEVDNSIRSTLGEATFAQYQSYEQTLPKETWSLNCNNG